MSKKASAVLASLALAVPLAIGVAVPASAAPTGRVKTALAPSCVKVVDEGRSWYGWPWVKVKNTCSTAKRVKIVWAFADDSACLTIRPGKTVKDSTGAAGRFDGLRSC